VAAIPNLTGKVKNEPDRKGRKSLRGLKTQNAALGRGERIGVK